MKIKALPRSERPVEKTITKGASALSNSELLAILLGSGTREKSAIGLAEDIISKDKSGISHLAESSVQELMSINGVGQSKAARVVAAVELGKRISTAPRVKRMGVESSDDIARLFIEDMRYEKREIFKALLLNPRGEIISIETVSVGELTSTLVHPREVFSQAVKRSAAGIVFVHNHPSGNPEPSEEDIKTTERLVACGKLLGIVVIDHIIIGDGQYCSMQSLGLMDVMTD
ncbi:MAG: DNA repair protein RadC [Firmicutes bacterium]|nr:DNA repair protein RadC [Bacillota bacterium]